MVVLDIYRITNGYQVDQVEYGNYAATKKVIPPEKPAFIQFPDPAYTSRDSSPSSFIEAFYNYDGTNTVLTIKWFNPQLESNVQSATNSITGSISTVASSKPDDYNCRILRDATSNTYFIYSFNSANNSLVLSAPLTTTLSGITTTGSNVWAISSNCDRFSVNSKVFRKINSTYQATSNNNSFAMDFIDQNLTYATVGSAIWKFDNTQGKYIPYATVNTAYSITAIKSFQNRVIVIASNSSSAVNNYGVQVIAFLD